MRKKRSRHYKMAVLAGKVWRCSMGELNLGTVFCPTFFVSPKLNRYLFEQGKDQSFLIFNIFIFFAFSLVFLPESPKFLISQGKQAEALQVE
jgi:hypothetical protein